MSKIFRVAVNVVADCEKSKLHVLDQEELEAITGEHSWAIGETELPKLLAHYKADQVGCPTSIGSIEIEEQAYYILEQWALDKYHDFVAIKVLDDFTIESVPSEEAIEAMVKIMAAKPAQEPSGPSL